MWAYGMPEGKVIIDWSVLPGTLQILPARVNGVHYHPWVRAKSDVLIECT